MASVAELKIRPGELSFRVLQMDPARATPERAARAVMEFLQRKRSALWQTLDVSAGPDAVIIRASGETPEAMLEEAKDTLGLGEPETPQGEIEVDAGRFTIEVTRPAEEPPRVREVLRAQVRYFPYPICEWFEISMGILTLTDRQVIYEPLRQIMQDEAADRSGRHVIPLEQIEDFRRGEWWDVPCLLLETSERIYRYGWPAERGELDTILDVDEWLERLRALLGYEEE